MATLCVKNVPDDRYEALRRRAKQNGSTISAEVITLLRAFVPTKRELRRRRAWFRELQKIRQAQPAAEGQFASGEEMLREDRNR